MLQAILIACEVHWCSVPALLDYDTKAYETLFCGLFGPADNYTKVCTNEIFPYTVIMTVAESILCMTHD